MQLASHNNATLRNTSPLDPRYPVPAASTPHNAFPVAAQPSKTVEGHCFERRRHPDWEFKRGQVPLGSQNRDIDCSVPAPEYRRVRHDISQLIRAALRCALVWP